MPTSVSDHAENDSVSVLMFIISVEQVVCSHVLISTEHNIEFSLTGMLLVFQVVAIIGQMKLQTT